jgi:hypothetical protein
MVTLPVGYVLIADSLTDSILSEANDGSLGLLLRDGSKGEGSIPPADAGFSDCPVLLAMKAGPDTSGLSGRGAWLFELLNITIQSLVLLIAIPTKD